MNSGGGTPKSVKDAITIGMMTGALSQIRENTINRVTEVLNNKFGAAIFMIEERQERGEAVDAAEILRELLEALKTGEPPKNWGSK